MNIKKIEALFKASNGKYIEAELMGLSYQSIKNILEGNDPRVSTIEKIAKHYNLPVGYFFDELDKSGRSMVNKSDRRSSKDLEIERLKGQIKAYQDALDRLGFSLKGTIIEDF